MITLSLSQIASILEAQLIGDGNLTVENVSTDSRKAVNNGLFFALKGENFDAHDYVMKAAEQGCVAAVVEHPTEGNIPQLIVKDSPLALGLLAKWLREKINPKVVAMTGSSGKTTVKEMTASILQQSAVDFDDVLFTQGNFNNDIGVPLTLLRLTEKHKFAVIELGANHIGEIAYTTALAQPDVALVNNVMAAHLEGFGSLDGVATAKGEIFRGLTQHGVAIINKAHNYSQKWQAEIGDHSVQYFAYDDPKADYYAENIVFSEQGAAFVLHTPQGNVQIDSPYLGEHNVSNALAATALTMNVGATLEQVKKGLETPSLVKGRLFPIVPCENLLLLDDSYNANVGSMKSAISVLQKYSAFRVFVVGDMAELGDNTPLCHQDVGEFARAAKLDLVISFGRDSAAISAVNLGRHFTDKTELVAYLTPIIKQQLTQQKVVVLVKGSRSMKMEDVIDLLKGNFLC
ncbi:UDP-N-acetylmuramoyl-tripeptide--D-alanyl-D-alanine ligase [Aggregatibacter sp.]